MNYELLIDKIKAYVNRYLAKDNDCYCFHNDRHTYAVVDAVQELSAFYQLSDADAFTVLAAAYFHDLGYLDGGAENHEQRSAALAAQFLAEHQLDAAQIEQVRSCILATKVPQSPQNLLEEILCDADLFHLGSAEFLNRDKLLRQEIEAVAGNVFDKKAWRKGTMAFLSNHRYHTSYAQQKLNPGKEKNMHDLANKEKMLESESPKVKGEKNKNKGDKDAKPDRGIETMFRITSTNNQRLSDMADNKANILITVNSIILSVVIAFLLRKLDNNAYLVIPTLILLIVTLITVVIAILATRPKVSAGYFTKEEVDNKEANLLFFGNFHKMSLPDYKEGMLKAMEDRDYLYGMLIKDVYSQGVVLGRKYRLLRYAYSIFMYGIIASVCAFIIAIYTL